MQKRIVTARQLDLGGERYIHSELPATKPTKDPILELQLSMATSSINHEYARMEFDETIDRERREELLIYMDDCRSKYSDARAQLCLMSPTTVEKFEEDLSFQKRATLQQFHA